MHYHNENNPHAAQWLRNLIAAGLLPLGIVDERSVCDVQADDLHGFTHCHFFAGVGVWPYALRVAGWPSDRPIWTGSCPCQPFSDAGQRAGTADARHLWPVWFELIKKCRPSIIIGEQVASKAALSWWDSVSDDLENAGHACAAADLCAPSVGAPHIRQRLFWMAHAQRDGQHGSGDVWTARRLEPANGGGAGGLGNAESERGRLANGSDRPALLESVGTSEVVRLAHRFRARLAGRPLEPARQECPSTKRGGDVGRLAYATVSGRAGDQRQAGERTNGTGNLGRLDDAASPRCIGTIEKTESQAWDETRLRVSGTPSRFNYACEWIECSDGKYRPVEPGTQQMADGIARGMVLLCADQQTKCAITHAEKSIGFRDEILRALRRHNDPFEIWQSIGRRLGISQATLLLAFLCQYPRELGQLVNSQETRSTQGEQIFLRALFIDKTQNACSSQGWGLSEQCAAELGNLMSELSQESASFRRIVAELQAFSGSPLAYRVAGRVGQLRAYGNAIVAPLAVEFIETVMELI